MWNANDEWIMAVVAGRVNVSRNHRDIAKLVPMSISSPLFDKEIESVQWWIQPRR
jgi:hypothetical protein